MEHCSQPHPQKRPLGQKRMTTRNATWKRATPTSILSRMRDDTPSGCLRSCSSFFCPFTRRGYSPARNTSSGRHLPDITQLWMTPTRKMIRIVSLPFKRRNFQRMWSTHRIKKPSQRFAIVILLTPLSSPDWVRREMMNESAGLSN